MTETITLPIDGGCQCGQLRYRVSRPPNMVHACHCRDCQVRTGSAFSMAMRVRTDGFEILDGVDTVTSLRCSPKGQISVHHHCPACFVRTHTITPERPEIVTVRPGTLDDTRWLRPAVQLWTESAMPWAIAAIAPALCREAEDYTAFRAEWRLHYNFVKL